MFFQGRCCVCVRHLFSTVSLPQHEKRFEENGYVLSFKIPIAIFSCIL